MKNIISFIKRNEETLIFLWFIGIAFLGFLVPLVFIPIAGNGELFEQLKWLFKIYAGVAIFWFISPLITLILVLLNKLK